MTDYDILNIVTSSFSAFTECDIEYPNVTLDVRDVEEWVRISVKAYTPKTLSITKTSAIRYGCVYIQVFVRPNTGAGRAAFIAAAAADIFESKIINSIEFDYASITHIGYGQSASPQSQESNWYQINVAIDYKVVV